MYSIQCNNVIIITVDRVGELKDLMIDASRPYVSVLCSTVNRRESDAQTHLLLGSNFLFYFIRYYGHRFDFRFFVTPNHRFHDGTSIFVLFLKLAYEANSTSKEISAVN